MSPSARFTRSSRFLLLLALLILPLSACQLVLDSNYTLAAGESVSGSLLIPSANVTLEEGSLVEGSAVVFCCNVSALGDVEDGVFVGAGNLTVGPQARVGGDVTLVEGNLSVEPGATVEGQTQRGLPARLILAALALLCAAMVIPLALVVVLVRRWRRGRGELAA